MGLCTFKCSAALDSLVCSALVRESRLQLVDPQLIAAALDRRGELIDLLTSEETDAYRLFHGVAEGCPGLAIDRYGPLVVVQSFREPLDPNALVELRPMLEVYGTVVYRHHGDPAPLVAESYPEPPAELLQQQICRELGIRYEVAVGQGVDNPLLFLDLRAARRFILRESRRLSVLNLFAYTCGAGLCAAAGGASEVLNVDFSGGALGVGERNARLNRIAVGESFRLMQEDVIPVIRQLADLPVKGRGARRWYRRLEPRQFDLIVLDPPQWAKSRFGAVDVVRDYQSLFKPVLLATVPGGRVIATNHVARVSLEAWVGQLERCAEKAGRPLRAVDVIAPEKDYPSYDGRHPLKIAVCSV